MDIKTLYNLIKDSPMSFDELEDYLKISDKELNDMIDSLISDKLIRITDKNVYKTVSKKREPKFKEVNLSKEYIESLILNNMGMLKQLKHMTGATEHEVLSVLDEMISKGDVKRINDKFILIKTARVFVTETGVHIARIDSEPEGYILSSFESSDLFDGDIIKISPKINYDGDKTANILEVVERSHQFIVGEIVEKTKNGKKRYIIRSNTPKFELSLRIDEDKLNGALPGMIVKASLKYMAGLVMVDNILEILGNKDDPGMEIAKIALEYGFELDFPQDVKEELKTIPNHVLEADLGYRRDFRDKIVFTVDGDTSKDFDDAISLDLLSNGNYSLGVYIADVSHYVKFQSPLDIEAIKRGTSLYLADRVIPMLPHELSNGICSLNEGVDRLVLACIMEISPKGKLVNYDICEGVITSKHRMTYNNVNKMLNGDTDVINKYQDIYDSVLNMASLSKIIRELRYKKGALEFDTTEFQFILNADGSPKEIIRRERYDAEKLIEDFMLMANETVAYHMNIMNLPIVYRIHEKPDQEKLHKTLDEVKALGVDVRTTKNDIHPKELQTILSSIDNNPNKDIISNMLLRSMMKAKYSSECLGHYGLAMNYYCHFTSPIRRYPDLMTHRMIKKLLLHPSNKIDDDVKKFSALMPEVALKNSSSERRAVDCERSVDDMLYAWYMESRLNKEYTGTIRSITSFGMFIEIENGIEGLFLYKNSYTYFSFNEKNCTAIANDKIYHVGDKVKVICIRAERTERRIDFDLKGC